MKNKDYLKEEMIINTCGVKNESSRQLTTYVAWIAMPQLFTLEQESKHHIFILGWKWASPPNTHTLILGADISEHGACCLQENMVLEQIKYYVNWKKKSERHQ